MMRYEIRTEADALAYALDCQLATVEGLIYKKSKSKYDFDRQIALAQNLLDFCVRFKANVSATRGADVIKSGLTVEAWAKRP